MKISVIIPTYKPQDYLWNCLDSLVAQTFPKNDFEVILVLNGCNEPYKSAIERYVSERMGEMYVNFIHTEVGGVSNARNLALDQVKGEFVTFIDDDDFVSPRYLELLYEKIDSQTISLCCPYAFKDGYISEELSYSMKDVYLRMHNKTRIRISSKIRSYFSGPCMKLIPMDFVQDRRFDIRFKNGEDTLFMFLISDRIKQIKFAKQEAIYYRRYREGSAVTGKRKRSDIIKSNLRQMGVYSKYFMRRPLKYNWSFFCTRILGSIMGCIK